MARAISVLSIAFVPFVLPPAGRANGEVEFVTEELPWAVLGRAYSPAPFEVRVTGRCPAGGVGFAVVSGTLPPGLQLSRLGYFSGTPKQVGQFEFNVKAVNGCSWAGRHFALLVTDAPKLAATPAKVAVVCALGDKPGSAPDHACPDQPGTNPPATIHVVGSWPNLAYQVSVSGGTWLTAVPERGATSREAVPPRIGEIHSDAIALRVHTAGLKPGLYDARVVISAWQADSVVVPVEVTVTDSP